jgi:hypothetical protein
MLPTKETDETTFAKQLAQNSTATRTAKDCDYAAASKHVQSLLREGALDSTPRRGRIGCPNDNAAGERSTPIVRRF